MGLQWSANKPLYEIKIRGWSSYFCIDFLISLSCFHINFWNMQYFLYLARLKVLPGLCTTKWVQHTVFLQYQNSATLTLGKLVINLISQPRVWPARSRKMFCTFDQSQRKEDKTMQWDKMKRLKMKQSETNTAAAAWGKALYSRLVLNALYESVSV